MKSIALIVVTLLLTSCYGMADYNGPPAGAQGDGLKPIDPEALRVNSNEFPAFHVIVPVSPPPKKSQYRPFNFRDIMVDILPTDKWIVSYKWKDLYLITSDTYTQRQCEFHGDCAQSLFSRKYEPQRFHAIYLSKEGEVSGGWKLLGNKSRMVLSSDRRTYFNPSDNGNLGWEEVQFEKTL